MNHHELIIALFYPEIEAPVIENEAEVILGTSDPRGIDLCRLAVDAREAILAIDLDLELSVADLGAILCHVDSPHMNDDSGAHWPALDTAAAPVHQPA
jgi:hypothetical protein